MVSRRSLPEVSRAHFVCPRPRRGSGKTPTLYRPEKLVLTCPLDNCRHQADDQKKLYERMMEIYAGYLEHPVNNLCFDFAWVVAYSCVGE